MSNKRLFRQGQKFQDWKLLSYLGGGGNGEVWSCQNTQNEVRAIKILKKIKPVAYDRFKDETIVIEGNSDIEGIFPIIDKHLPKVLGDHIPFYIMPIAESMEIKLSGKSIEEKIDAIIQVAETLSKLHERNIYHRDIKPDNILFYNGRYSLVDFGLVDYPEKKEISTNNEEIGPKWTMAPEMKRESSSADFAKADTYSLAKTLWILLTGRIRGFDGQYTSDSIVELKQFYPKYYTSPIDNLLIASTDNDPKRRPTVIAFIDALVNWKNLMSNFHQRNQQQWFEIQTKLFPAAIPARVIWDDLNDITKVLKTVCSFKNLNHVFLPSGGGLDLADVKLSHEKGCLELDFDLIHIIKPRRLIFESFGFDPEWNYFRLELDELDPSEVADSIKENNRSKREDLSELSPGQYYPFSVLNDRYRSEKDYLITQYSRHVTRWLTGSFVIFCKRSLYNRASGTYEGGHNRVTTDQFRDNIKGIVRDLKVTANLKLHATNSSMEAALEPIVFTKHLIEADTVYRCAACGSLLGADGIELEGPARAYAIKVFEKFGNSLVTHIAGSCCKDEQW